jgi:hypothetical protein
MNSILVSIKSSNFLAIFTVLFLILIMEVKGIFLVNLTFLASAAAVDYCTLCTNHIACNNAGLWSAICPADAVLVDFTIDMKTTIVNMHNEYRNTIASGGVPGFNSAVEMNKLVNYNLIFKLLFYLK